MRVVVTSAFIFLAYLLQAQSNHYFSDLAALRAILEKTHSFKSQIKGQKLIEYNKLYNKLAGDSLYEPNDYRYFYNLAQLTFPITDNHIGLDQVPDYQHFQSKETIAHYVSTKEFAAYTTLSINIDSLKSVLIKKPIDSLEGVYHYGKYYSVGLFKSTNKEYIGVVLDSDVNLWQKGQIAMQLYPFGEGLYKAIYGHPLTKNYLLQPIEKYRNQTLVNSNFYGSYFLGYYSKNTGEVDYVNLPVSVSKLELKRLSSEVQYLRIQSFQLNQAIIKSSKAFSDSINKLTLAPNLIVDLRNNQGGAKKATVAYYKPIKKASRKGRVYVMINNETISQAEIFTLKLSKLKNVTTLGQTTKGMLTYGSNYGKRLKLPSGNFQIYPTDMRGFKKHLKYENRGIHPYIELSPGMDWIEQVVDVIKKD